MHHAARNAQHEFLKRFEQQSRRLIEAVRLIAQTIAKLEPDPEHPDTPPRALLVGGLVRDLLLDRSCKDADLEIYGVRPDQIEKILRDLFPERVISIGRSFGILKIILDDGLEVDVAVPRRESKSGEGHKGFDVDCDPWISVRDAARRRDFTLNSILADPLTGELLDPFNGQTDLTNSVLRVTDPDHFSEDPLRVYRAVQFAARFELTVEAQSLDHLRLMVERGALDELPAERVTDELKKLLLKAERPSPGLTLARELGIIERYFPELQALIDTPQEAEWHPEGDVWIHTLMVVDVAARLIRQAERGLTDEEKLGVMLGALCHDLGKPATTKLAPKNGIMRLRSLGHETAGTEPARSLLSRLSFSRDVERIAVQSAQEHLKPGMLHRQLVIHELTEEQYQNAIRKFLRRIHPTRWQVMLTVSEADYRGRALPSSNDETYIHGAEFARAINSGQLAEEPMRPLIQGRDLLELGLKPGPDIGHWIQAVENLRDAGQLKTREEAIAWLKKQLGCNPLIPPYQGEV